MKKRRKPIFYSWGLGVHVRVRIVTGRLSSPQYQRGKGPRIKHGDGVCICYQAAAIFKGRNREWVQGRKEDAAVFVFMAYLSGACANIQICFQNIYGSLNSSGCAGGPINCFNGLNLCIKLEEFKITFIPKIVNKMKTAFWNHSSLTLQYKMWNTAPVIGEALASGI